MDLLVFWLRGCLPNNRIIIPVGVTVKKNIIPIITGAMIALNTVAEANMADDSIGQDQLKSVVSLQILNSSGVVVKTMFGAGA